MVKKYNPNLKGIVDNVRREATAKGINTESYTDEEIYNVFNYWYGVMDDSNISEDCRLDDLREGIKR